MKISLLDCTLRDGGYVNNWQFGDEQSLRIFKQLQCAKVDVVEVGYLRSNKSYVRGSSVYPNTAVIDEYFSGIPKHCQIAAMIDYGDCSLDSLKSKAESIVDVLRITFRRHQIDEALRYCQKIIDLGYKVCLQPVSVTSYSEKDMMNLCTKVNKLHPNTLCIVDSYGLLDEEQLLAYYKLLEDNLDVDIGIGYHSHNNFQLAYSNTIHLIKQNSARTLILEGSLYGMGKSAGNCNTELLAMCLNKRCGKNYDINEILDVIESCILRWNNTCKWGYQLRFYVSALHQVHPNYVNYLIDKGFAMRDISEIVGKVKHERALIFDKDYLEKLCEDHARQRHVRSISEEGETYNKGKEGHSYAVIFDVDGTLLNTTSGIINAVKYVVEQCKLTDLSKVDLESFVAYSPLKAAFVHYCGVTEHDAIKCCSLYKEYYKEHAKHETQVYDGVEDMLEMLKRTGYRLGVATFKDEENAKNLLKRFQLDQYFDYIAGNQYEKNQTKTDILVRCAENMKLHSSQIYFIGDTEGDKQAAEEAKARFVGVNYGFGFRNVLGYANSPEEIPELLEKI